MVFALDATPLTVPTGGIRRYTESLAVALAKNYPEDQFHLISDRRFSFETAAPNLLHQSVTARRWWSLHLPRTLKRLRADLFHGTDFAVPYLPVRPSVLTLHDLSPWRTPSVSTRRVRRRTAVLLRSGVATMVITPTEAIRREAIEYFGLRPDRVVAIPLAASKTFRPVDVVATETPYFLFAGTLETRKNVDRLIIAWREVRKSSSVALLIAGRASGEPPAPEPGLRLLGAVPDDQLPALYSGAAAFVYPSLYEGFGLPVLEAMQCGALVIASRDPAMMEVTGASAAIHVDAEDTGALATAMKAALSGDTRVTRNRALMRARDFNWNTTARRTREVYDAAIRVFSGS